MIILMQIKRETLQVFFKESPRAELRWFAARKQQNYRCCGFVDRDMLTRVWDEMDYCIDVCRTNKSGHIEHLWNIKKKKKLGQIICISV
jgi:hypothetical protein